MRKFSTAKKKLTVLMATFIMEVIEINVRRETEKCISYNFVDKLTEDCTLKIKRKLETSVLLS